MYIHIVSTWVVFSQSCYMATIRIPTLQVVADWHVLIGGLLYFRSCIPSYTPISYTREK